jgi:hypothetical protein
VLSTYRFSLIYIIVLAAITLFHSKLAGWIAGSAGQDFASYVIYGMFLAFFLILLIKTIAAKRGTDVGLVLLTLGLVFFFLLSHPMLIFKMTILELFILGLLVAWEGKKSKSLISFLIIFIGALVVEVMSNFAVNTHFYYFDVWQNSLVVLSGYLSGSLLN